MTKQAAYLTDTFYMYALAVNRSLTEFPNDPLIYRNGSVIHSNLFGTFDGYSGQVKMNVNGTREPVINVLALDSSGQPKVYFVIERQDNTTSVSSKTISGHVLVQLFIFKRTIIEIQRYLTKCGYCHFCFFKVKI